MKYSVVHGVSQLVRALQGSEESLAMLLAQAGLSRPAARCLVCLVRGGDWTSSRLAEGASLSQPGVSQGMRELVASGLGQRGVKRNGGKGRPAHIYTLAGPAGDVLRSVEEARRKVLTEELEVLDALRSRIRGLGS